MPKAGAIKRPAKDRSPVLLTLRRIVVSAVMVSYSCGEPLLMAERSAEITQGTIDTDHTAVVGIAWEGHIECSAVLLDEFRVLSVAHCLAADSDMPTVVFNGSADEASYRGTDRIEYHPGYRAPLKADDLALIYLSQPAPAFASPVNLNGATLDRALLGENVVLVGFGHAGASVQEDTVDHQRYRGTSKVIELKAKSLVLGADPSLPCHGDSGGAVLHHSALIGLIQLADTNCDNEGHALRLDAYLDFVVSRSRAEASSGCSLGNGPLVLDPFAIIVLFLLISASPRRRTEHQVD